MGESDTKHGIILMNLGTPEAPTRGAVRQFLREFLSDRRVVEIPRLIWLPILYGIILPFRSPRVAKAYASIWGSSGSPLRAITERQVQSLQERFPPSQVKISYAFTYGRPGLQDRIDDLEREGYGKILIIPLYPQYSATTTAPVYDQYASLITSQRDISEISILKSYYRHPAYLDALAHSIQTFRARQGESEKLLISFHGIPRRCVEKGDPYEQQCQYTAQEVARRLNLAEDQWQISFQSRLGKAEWLRPYTDEVLVQWAQQGVRSVQVVCPAFATDCLETLEEIDVENRELFLSSGGEHFALIPCLNDSEKHISMFEDIVKQHFCT